MRSKRTAPLPLLVPVLALAAGCAGDGGGGSATSSTRPPGACPVPAAVVAEAVGHEVAVDRGAGGRSCVYAGEGGARVEVVERSLAEDGFGSVLEDVERRAGPTVLLEPGAVEGAERGWVATVGRGVQLGAASAEVLVVVAVVDPLLDAEAAEEVAAALAGEALEG